MEEGTRGWTAPALSVSAEVTIVRPRRLPLAGDVLVHPGQQVAPDDPVAEAQLPGRAVPLPLAGLLGCDPGAVRRLLLVRPGDAVRRGQRLALLPGVWGIGRREVAAPEDGVVEAFSPRSGQLLLRGRPTPLRLDAHVPGVVSSVWPGQGCEVRCRGAWVQGVFGSGGEARGPIRLPRAGMRGAGSSGSPPGDLCGAVCVAEEAEVEDLTAWAAAGARAAVVGGIGYRALAALRARHPTLAVVLTEGFGHLAMAPHTWGVLRRLEGAAASVDGTTQIRAGVVRPEVIVPFATGGKPPEAGGLAPRPRRDAGLRVRIVRSPDFGRTGVVLQRPNGPRAIATEAVLPVVLVRLDGGGTVAVPQANVEPVDSGAGEG